MEIYSALLDLAHTISSSFRVAARCDSRRCHPLSMKFRFLDLILPRIVTMVDNQDCVLLCGSVIFDCSSLCSDRIP